jgi:hypothetical protein
MKTTTIVSVVDIVAALAEGNLDGNLYLMDTNRLNGSRDQGSARLKTAVGKGDRLIWVARMLECEADLSIVGIGIDSSVGEPSEHYYPGTNVTYWEVVVKEELRDHESIPYCLEYKLVGTEIMATPKPADVIRSPCLVGVKG